MHLTPILLIVISILPQFSVFAVTTQKIVSTNQVLEDLCIQDDKDVLAVTVVNGLTKAKVNIPSCIMRFV